MSGLEACHNFALIGWGTVGGGVLDILATEEERLTQRYGFSPRCKRIITRNPSRQRDQDTLGAKLSSDFNDALNDPEISSIVLLVGGTEIAKDMCIQALEAGKHVITANKAIIADFWTELFACAKKNNVCLAYEAAVAGSIPVIAGIRENFAANSIRSIHGILNGTCNFILSKMEEEGLSYETALDEAKELGYAEADPTLDVNGMDTAHKLSILCRLAFGVNLPTEKIAVEGIESISAHDIALAKRFDARIKLLGIADFDGENLHARVAPSLVPYDNALAGVQSNFNAISIDNHAAGPSLLVGQGAGALPTASAVLADLISVLSGRFEVNGPINNGECNVNVNILTDGNSKHRLFCRFALPDTPGILAKLCEQFSQADISIQNIHQSSSTSKKAATVEVLTHPCVASSESKILDLVNNNVETTEKPVILRYL